VADHRRHDDDVAGPDGSGLLADEAYALALEDDQELLGGVRAPGSSSKYTLALAAVPVALEIGKPTRTRMAGSSSDWISMVSMLSRLIACMMHLLSSNSRVS
jgi:hypothetical protein